MPKKSLFTRTMDALQDEQPHLKLPDVRRSAAGHLGHLRRDPGDLKGEDMLVGFAIAQAGRSPYPGWIPEVQREGCANADVARLLLKEPDAFTYGYLTAALWTETYESNEQGGEPLDRNYTISDLHESALDRAKLDCAKFQRKNKADLDLYETVLFIPPNLRTSFKDGRDEAEWAGHDFLLTRNGHGAGFWDRELGELGDRLTKACDACGNFGLYAYRGKIYAC